MPPGRLKLRPFNSPSNAYLFARGTCSVIGASLGLFLAEFLAARNLLSEPINLLYLTLLGFLLGYLVSHRLAQRWERLWRRFIKRSSEIPPEVVLAAGVGATIALFITVLLNSLLEAIPGFTWYWSLLITVLLVTASSWFFVVNRHLFASRREGGNGLGLNLETSPERGTLKVIDTSAIIDGRIADVVEAHFLDGKILIPRFVLGELQHIADSDDPLRRKRGRRGLEVLDRLGGLPIRTEVVSDTFADTPLVDEKLVKLCQANGADLITTDYNLSQVATLQGVKVLNVNKLANAMRMSYLPGDRLSLHVVKEGREAGQGLAYLEDGTMVVIEDAAGRVGASVDAVVTSNLQTNIGRMIFAKLERA